VRELLLYRNALLWQEESAALMRLAFWQKVLIESRNLTVTVELIKLLATDNLQVSKGIAIAFLRNLYFAQNDNLRTLLEAAFAFLNI